MVNGGLRLPNLVVRRRLPSPDARSLRRPGAGEPFEPMWIEFVADDKLPGLSVLLCSSIRLPPNRYDTRQLTVEQVRRGLNTWPQYHNLPQPLRDE